MVITSADDGIKNHRAAFYDLSQSLLEWPIERCRNLASRDRRASGRAVPFASRMAHALQTIECKCDADRMN
jgi:hypothetical protein